jgi:hypothetical protein
MPTDPRLFELDDLPSASRGRSLAIRPGSERPLSKDERAFNRALARVQALGRALDEERDRLDRLLVFHAAEIAPRREQAVARRTALVRALAPFLDDRRVTKGQRRVLQQILVEQLDEVLPHLEVPDEDLQALFERIHEVSYADVVQGEVEDARADMAAMFEALGLDVDVPELRADMTPEDLAAVAARLSEGLHRAGEQSSRADEGRRATKRQLKEAERARQYDEQKKDSLGAVYRRLVKQMHPDLEPDPGERERKSRVMQDITAAYGRNDLRMLLQLELEWLGDGGADAARLSDDKLRAYTAVLKQQAAELQSEVQSLRLHPRYAPILSESPWGFPVLLDGPHELQRLEAVLEQLDAAVGRLRSGDALQEVRGAIREYQAAQKRRRAAGGWRHRR